MLHALCLLPRHITPKHLANDLKQKGVYGRIAGNHVADPDMIVAAREVRNLAFCFLYQEVAGSNVPGTKAEFPKAVTTATGNIGEIKGCRPTSTNITHLGKDPVKASEIAR